MKKLIISLIFIVTLLGSFCQAYAAEPTGNSGFDSFISDSRFSEGTFWNYYQSPKLSHMGSGCCAYCADFAKYCFGASSPRDGSAFTDTSEIRAGDVLTVGNQSNGKGHWFICLKRDGNRLYVAEGNYGSKVRIGWNYTILSSNTLGGTDYTFTEGYHFIDSYSVTQKDGYSDSLRDITSQLNGKTVRLYSKESGQYVCGESRSTVHADGDCGTGSYRITVTADGWAGFQLPDGKWLSVQDYDYLRTTATNLQSWECFRIYEYQGNIYLLAQKNKKFVQVTNEIARPLRAVRNQSDGYSGATWERFDLKVVI